MCSGKEWPTPQTCLAPRDAKRRLREIQERQVASVCVGIDHMMKRRKMGRFGSPAASFGTTHARAATAAATSTTGAAATSAAATTAVAVCDRDHLASCRLCKSTRRVLSIARAHGKRCQRDGSNCGACGIWAKVMDRCASLGIIAANGTSSAWPVGDGTNGLLLSVGVGGVGGANGGGDGNRK